MATTFPQLAWVREGFTNRLVPQVRHFQMLTNDGRVQPYVQLFEIKPEDVGKDLVELEKIYPCTLVDGSMIFEKVKVRDAPEGAPVAPAAS
jgi:hypothetical protein